MRSPASGSYVQPDTKKGFDCSKGRKKKLKTDNYDRHVLWLQYDATVGPYIKCLRHTIPAICVNTYDASACPNIAGDVPSTGMTLSLR